MTTVHMFSAFDLVGFEYGSHRIWWTEDNERPTMSARGVDGRELSQVVANRDFDVPPGPIAKRRPAMRKAALAFFAPLTDPA